MACKPLNRYNDTKLEKKNVKKETLNLIKIKLKFKVNY